MRNALAKTAAVAASVAVGVARGFESLAQSQGMHEVLDSFNRGRAEAANMLLHGHAAAIYPGTAYEGPQPKEPEIGPPKEQAVEKTQEVNQEQPYRARWNEATKQVESLRIQYDKILASEPITPGQDKQVEPPQKEIQR